MKIWLLIFSVFMLAFLGCSDDNSKDEEVEARSKELIVGAWSYNWPDSEHYRTMRFEASGGGIINDSYVDLSGPTYTCGFTYRIKGRKIVLMTDDGTKGWVPFHVDENTLWIEDTNIVYQRAGN